MVTTNEQIRQAAEILIRSGSYQTLLPSYISHSHSITTIPSVQDHVMAEDLIAGRSVQGRMSNVRRFFCLFVTFDLAFIGLMWLICTMINGENIHIAFEKQIIHYSIYTSLFDIVLAALCRFIGLLLFYGLLGVNHWFVIALSTTGTCALLTAKVFVYNWVDSHQPVFDVLLILLSFVVAWGEAWFLDFRVIPQEIHAQQFLSANRETEREPLVRNYIEALPDRYTESVANFYSPLVSPNPSIHGGDYQRPYLSTKLSSEQENQYKRAGSDMLQESWKLLNSSNWKLEKHNKQKDCIYITQKSKNKIFKLEGLVDVAPRYLLEELFYRFENLPQWNPAVLESHKVQTIDEHTDITYQISADAPGISSRDFVSLRHWSFIDDCYVIAYKAIEHPSVPKTNDKYIRGENVIGCWAMRPVQGKTDVCQFQWLFNTNLKGWIPQGIVDRACKGVLLDFIKNLRHYIKHLKEIGTLPS